MNLGRQQEGAELIRLLPLMDSIPEAKTTATENGIAVVMVPLPAQGHLNPLLQLSAHLTNHGIDVHYIGSATHNRQARHRTHRGFHGLSASSSHRLHFHDLTFPSIPSSPPTINPRLAFPSHLQPSFDAAAAHLLPHLSSLLLSLSLSHRRIVLLLDSAMQFAASTSSLIPNIEIFVFHTSSAIGSLYFLQQYLGRPQDNPILPGLHTRVSFEDCISDGFREFIFRQMRSQTAAIAGRIMNTSRAIEGAILDQLAEEWKVGRVFAVGPLTPVTAVSGEHHEDECVRWLDQQPTASVIYVSFGTTSSLSSVQLRELAAGLAASEQRFLWVRRDADRCDVFAAGPDARHGDPEDWTVMEETLKRVGGKCKVVQGWAPQMEILAHASTGGFISHCGWNSLMEAAGMGVPILAWPMHSDQPVNAELVTTVLRTGMWIREWGDRGKTVTAAKIKEAITRLIAGEEGKEVTRRAKEVGQKLRAAVEDGGSSKDDLDGFVAQILRPL